MKYFPQNNLTSFSLAVILLVILASRCTGKEKADSSKKADITFNDSAWEAPSLYTEREPVGKERELLIYGQDLIAHTARYFGPQGVIAQTTNGMNCQNCHLDAGARPWGNSFGAVAATYPKFRSRSGQTEDIYKRINDCFERSMNGQAVDSTTKEMRAMHAYLVWLGKTVPKGKSPKSSRLQDLPYPAHAADPQRGKIIYETTCSRCHGNDGQGQKLAAEREYVYPPLWGEHSYNTGAGMYRLSSFASFVYGNMPFDQATHQSPVLTVEQAWDVAAFVNSQPRPSISLEGDYQDISKKPFDYPFGPYADQFTESQHKYGPFGPIIAASKK